MAVVLVMVCLLCGLYCHCLAEDGWKIVGGKDAPNGAFPHQVSLRNKNRHFCGGSILNDHWILTAAHCVTSGRVADTTVVVGTNTLDAGGDIYEVEKFVEHDQYSPSDITDDIALVKVKTPIKLTENVKTISLPTENTSGDVDVTLSGWGTTSYPGKIPNKLQTIKLRSIDVDKCKAMHPKFKVVPSQICTLTKEGEGACHGDSGGPLTHENYQVGIVSWGKPCAKGKPDVFTRVFSYIDWINKHMKE